MDAPAKMKQSFTSSDGWKEIGPSLDPVLRAVFFHAEEQVEHQQRNARGRRQIAELLRPLQIAQEPAEDQEHRDPGPKRDHFLFECVRVGGRDHTDAQRRQEQRDCLHVEAAPAHQPQQQESAHSITSRMPKEAAILPICSQCSISCRHAST